MVLVMVVVMVTVMVMVPVMVMVVIIIMLTEIAMIMIIIIIIMLLAVQSIVRTSDVRVSNRVNKNSVTLDRYPTVYNDLTGEVSGVYFFVP